MEPRIPPHNTELERAALCAALIDSRGFLRLIDDLTPEAFYDHRHSLIFDAMSRLFNKSIGIDALTVSNELQTSGDLQAAGGDSYLATLSMEVSTAANAEHYAKSIREYYRLREIILVTASYNETAYVATAAEPLLYGILSNLFDISNDNGSQGAQAISAVIPNLLDNYDRNSKSHGMVTGCPSGFHQLDYMTSGFQPGDLVVLAARPSMGKTAMALDIARHAASGGVPIAMFSLEMSSMAIGARIVAATAMIDLHRLRSGKLRNAEWPTLSDAAGKISNMPFYIDDSGSIGIMEMRARARQLKQQHDIGLIIVDYLQLMKPPKAHSREQEVAQISRGLKSLAKELNIPVIALSQLSRAVEQRGGGARPQLSDLRDSGAIEQDADLVIFIHRPGLYKIDQDTTDSNDSSGEGSKNLMQSTEQNQAEILIRKQRNCPTGDVNLVFIRECSTFKNPSTSADTPDDTPF